MHKLCNQIEHSVHLAIRPAALCLISAVLLPSTGGALAAPDALPPASARSVSLNGVPLNFEVNVGQAPREVQYLAHGPAYAIGLTRDGAELALLPSTAKTGKPPVTVKLMVAGTSAARAPMAEEPLPGRINYFIGNDPTKWRSDVETYGRVRYAGVYPGVDLVYYGTNGRLEYDFGVAPGAKASPIRLAFRSVERMRIDAQGNLQIRAGDREIVFERPVAYQLESGQRKPVIAEYRLEGHSVGFELGAYDHSKALIIDPVLRYLSYLGGNSQDTVGALPSSSSGVSGQAAAIDGSGDLYVTGYTASTNFPTQAPFAGPTPKQGGTWWAFVTKFAPDAKSLVFSTYLGGSASDFGQGIAVDRSGNAFVVGYTSSNDFPITESAYQKLCSPTGTGTGTVVSNCSDPGNNGATGGFVTKLSPTGALLDSTYLSGTAGASPYAVALDTAGRPYVAGYAYPGVTESQGAGHNQSFGFPTTAGAIVSAYGPVPDVNGSLQTDAFVSVFDPTLSTLVYSTLFGDSQAYQEGIQVGNTEGMAVTVDAAGSFYLAGYTADAYIPVTSGAIQTQISTCGTLYPGTNVLNGQCGFVAKFSPVGGSNPPTLTYGTYLGDMPHNGTTQISGIAADAAGDAYVTGYTNLAGFPTTGGAYQSTCDRYPASNDYDCNAAFIAKLSPNGKTLLASTYFGDYNAGYNGMSDNITSIGPIVLDAFDNVYIAGTAYSGLPQVNPLGNTSSQSSAPFVAELDPTLSTLRFSTLVNVGGAGQISIAGMALDAQGAVYLAGNTSTPNISAATPGVVQSGYSGGASDGFVAKLVPHPLTALAEQADFLGTGKADYAVWRPSVGEWYVTDAAGHSLTQQWGIATDLPVIGDFDGDGKTDIAVWRPSSGTWYVIDSSTQANVSKQWGQNGDEVVPGDYDGDGKTDIAVWRPSSGTWYVLDSSTQQEVSRQWGEQGDIPVPGDYDGDGKTDIAVWRPSNGTWYIIYSSTGAVVTQHWGASGDTPVPGNYDGSNKTNLAVWRPSLGEWYVLNSSGNELSQQWGLSSDIPVPKDYDGDGKTDYAVWRPSTGTWYVRLSSTQATVSQQWGVSTDVPLNAPNH